MNGLVHPLVDLGLAAAVALTAWRLRALTVSGVAAATLVGWAHATGGGVTGTAALLTFFTTSTLLSRLGKRRKEALGFEKGGTRDALQVLANGGLWNPWMLGEISDVCSPRVWSNGSQGNVIDID